MYLQLEFLNLSFKVLSCKKISGRSLEFECLLCTHLESIGVFLQPPLEEVHTRVEERLDSIYIT